MYQPGGWVPSKLATWAGYSPEGRLVQADPSRDQTGGAGVSNSLYETDAERFDVVTPFLAKALEKDRPRRNYIVQPGGATIYYGPRPAPRHPYGEPRPLYPAALDQVGHDSQDSRHETPTRATGGRSDR